MGHRALVEALTAWPRQAAVEGQAARKPGRLRQQTRGRTQGSPSSQGVARQLRRARLSLHSPAAGNHWVGDSRTEETGGIMLFAPV